MEFLFKAISGVALGAWALGATPEAALTGWLVAGQVWAIVGLLFIKE